MSADARAVAVGLCLAIPFMSAEAGRAVFTGANDVEPINAGFRRDKIVHYDTGLDAHALLPLDDVTR